MNETGTRAHRRVWRGPILLIVIAALVAAVIADRDSTDATTSGAAAAALGAAPAVPAADALSVSWFCAEGTSTPDGRAEETIVVASLADTEVTATISVLPGGDAKPVSRRVTVEPRGVSELAVADILPTAEPGVVVEVVGGQAVVSHELRGQGDVAVEPCARGAAPDWYFANGTTVKGVQQYLVIFNPFGDDAIIDAGFLTEEGVIAPDEVRALVVPRNSRVTIAVHDFVPRQALVAAHVHARSGRVVVERTQLFDGSQSEGVPVRQGIAVSLGANRPARTWELPVDLAGAVESGSAFTQTVAVANFAEVSTRVEVGVVLPGEETLAPQSVEVGARSVELVTVGDNVPAGKGFVVTVAARQPEGEAPPVVVELLSWWSDADGRRVASTLGTQAAARRWVLVAPAGSSGAITVAGARSRPAAAALLVFESGDTSDAPSNPKLAVPPERFGTFSLDERAGRTLVVEADRPVTVGLVLNGAAGGSASIAVPDPGAG